MSERITRNRKMYDPSAFIKMDVDVLLELDGDYEACALYAYLEYLLATKGANENGGWVILSYLDIEERLYMKRRAVDRAIALLGKIGLKTALKSSRFHGGAPVKHFQFDPIIYDEALNRIETSYSLRKTQRHEEFKKRRTGEKVAFVQNEQKAFVQNEQILEEVVLQEVKKDMQPPASEGLRSAPDTSLEATTPLPSTSKKKGKDESQEQPPPPPSRATPPSPKRPPRVQVTTTPPTTHDSADSPKPPRAPNDYQRIAGQVASVIFGIPEGETEKGMMKRVGLIAGYLWGSNKSMQAPRPKDEDATQKADNIIADIKAFKAWWVRVFRDATPPRDLAKFAEHWLKFWHDSRKSFYTPAPTYEVVVWNDYSDDENTEQG